ncbi:tetratricopeptide repeat protein [Brevundimonas sp.]|uniref:tetratricopeptide repeat protein n=1 Tax=Brevundimonas sp. TaxID=1871086 RepID=UPI0025B9106D|nr:tetratricopeptide repeat protein [Brevundimonas sp.]
MSAAALDDTSAYAPAPAAQGIAGDAASPAAISRLSKSLAGVRSVKAQRKGLELLKLSLAAIRVNDFDRATQRALDSLKLDETNGLAWHVLAICQEKQNRFGPAIHAYEAALQLLPDHTDIAHDLGRLAQRLGYLDISEKLLLKFLAANPGHIEATNNLACVMRDQNRYADAIETLRPLLQIEADSSVLWNTLGTVLNDQGRLDEALTFFEEALRLDPTFAKARYNRANVRRPLGDVAGAIEDMEAALPGAENGYEVAMMNMARALMLMGEARIPEAFEAYEVRLDPNLPDAMHVAVEAPRWDPKTEDIRGKRVLVVGEQGIADELVFANCLNDIIEAVGPEGQVYLAVEARMVGLFQRGFPRAIVGGHKAVRLEGRLTRYVPFAEELEQKLDCWVPIASLMAVYRPTLESFPGPGQVIVPDPDKVAYWRGELAKLPEGLKVGLHWKSLVMTGARAAFFAAGFQRWEPILTTPGCVMVNLQCGDVSEDLAAAEAAGVFIWTPPINLKDDLEDVAALSVACDVVLGPGIAGTNIAAASGARTWMVAAPDDWHLMTTDHYVFYPDVKIFVRGAVDGWPEVIDRMRAALDRVVAGGWNAA